MTATRGPGKSDMVGTVLPTVVLAALLVGVGATPARAQDTVSFGGQQWEVAGDVKVESHLGREAFLVRSGRIWLVDAEFRNGVIEFDVAMAATRTFTGVSFRMDQETRSAEEFYLRPHNSGRFDAIQYTPVYSGISAWQLYPEYNASHLYSPNEWLPVRLDISGDRMVATSRGDTLLVVDHLRGPQAAGRLLLQSSFPAQAEQPGFYPVAFSNIRVAPVAGPPPAARTAGTRAEEQGFITTWSLSPAFDPTADTGSSPFPTFKSESWTPADVGREGRLNIARFRALPAGLNAGSVLARVTLVSPVEQAVEMAFGFSDMGSVYLNGRKLFSANNTYLTRSGRYLGVMTSDNDALILPLREGENELVFLVTESFGGWGLVARLRSETGVEVVHRTGG